MSLKCPTCNNEQYCPCKNCAAKNAGKVTWKYIDPEIPIIACGHCGLQKTADEWDDIQYEQMKAEGKWPVHI